VPNSGRLTPAALGRLSGGRLKTMGSEEIEMGKAVNLVRDTNDEDCPTPCRPGVSFANFLLKNSSPSSAPVQRRCCATMR